MNRLILLAGKLKLSVLSLIPQFITTSMMLKQPLLRWRFLPQIHLSQLRGLYLPQLRWCYLSQLRGCFLPQLHLSQLLKFGLRTFNMGVMLSLVNVVYAIGPIAVFDSQLIAETIQQRTASMQQWAKDNEMQLSQLQQMSITHQFLEGQATMPYQNTWQDLQSIQEQSLALVHATQALWREFGAAQDYYVNFLMSSAWNNCMSTGHCSFNQALNNLDNMKLQQAMQSAEGAHKVNQQLEGYLDKLQQFTFQAHNSQSIASTLDTLTQITSNVDALLIQLNAQTASLSQLQSQAAAQKSVESTFERQYLQAISQHTDQEPIHVPQKMP